MRPDPLDDPFERFWELSPEERGKVFLTTAEASAKSGVSRRTIHNWIEADLIRAIRVGRRTWVLAESLKIYLQHSADT
jgi:excisionase family DNA binding protein